MGEAMRSLVPMLGALLLVVACSGARGEEARSGESFRPVPLQSRITGVHEVTTPGSEPQGP